MKSKDYCKNRPIFQIFEYVHFTFKKILNYT